MQPWAEIRAVFKNYDLGELVQSERNERGYLNTSYEIQTVQNGGQHRYFLRRYKAGILPGEIQFEHGLIRHLQGKNFSLVAGIMPTRDGETYVARPASPGSQQATYYTIFEFKPGQDKYTWIDPHCSPAEIDNAAAILARYHHTVSGFTPPGFRSEPGILQLLPLIKGNLENSPENSKNTRFDAFLQENLDLLLENCQLMQEYLQGIPKAEFPRLPIHCDFHPGNLRFKGEEIVALFDFDWSKIDLRVFDVGLALWYFFTSWEKADDGQLRLAEARQFLDRYQAAFESAPIPGPMSGHELQSLPEMINLGNLFVLNWTVMDFYAKPVDVDEYLIYLEHHVKFASWWSLLGRELIQEALLPDPT